MKHNMECTHVGLSEIFIYQGKGFKTSTRERKAGSEFGNVSGVRSLFNLQVTKNIQVVILFCRK